MIKLNDTRVRVIVAMCIHASVKGDLARKYLNDVLNKVQEDESSMVLDEESVTSDLLSGFYEWSKIAVAKFVAGYNKTLLAKLRRHIASYFLQNYGVIGFT